jgi:hypothetical protein
MTTNPDAQLATMIQNLKATSGKSLDEWVALAHKRGAAKHGELLIWLKGEHGLTHGYANLVAHSALKSDSGSQAAAGVDLVAEMFAGDKAAMRPIYDALMSAILAFGGDIEQAPKKGYMSLRRKTQFATLHPSTKSRFDVGLKLKGVEPAGRLEAAGSWNAMVTHRVRLASVGEVDKELVGWLRKAYAGA